MPRKLKRVPADRAQAIAARYPKGPPPSDYAKAAVARMLKHVDDDGLFYTTDELRAMEMEQKPDAK